MSKVPGATSRVHPYGRDALMCETYPLLQPICAVRGGVTMRWRVWLKSTRRRFGGWIAHAIAVLCLVASHSPARRKLGAVTASTAVIRKPQIGSWRDTIKRSDDTGLVDAASTARAMVATGKNFHTASRTCGEGIGGWAQEKSACGCKNHLGPFAEGQRSTAMRTIHVLAGALVAAMTNSALATGRVVAVGDEWIVSDSAYGYDYVNTEAFALNAASFMTGGGPGKFLIYSNNFGLNGSAFAFTLTNAGHQLIYDPSMALTSANLSGFSGVFLAGANGSGAVNAAELALYVNNGGSVFVQGGTGEFGPNPSNEAAGWNPFLNQFGLALGNQWIGPNGIYNVPLNAGSHPIHAGMNGVVWSVGQEVIDLDGIPTNDHTVALYADFTSLGESSNLGIVGVYSVPAPGGAAVTTMASLIVVRRRRDEARRV